MDNVLPVLPFVGIALLFYLFFMRPAQRRQQEMGRMRSELTVGDEVMLTSGIIGVVRSLDEETVQLEVSEGVTLRVVRAAVGQIRTPVTRDETTEPAAPVADGSEEKYADGTQ